MCHNVLPVSKQGQYKTRDLFTTQWDIIFLFLNNHSYFYAWTFSQGNIYKTFTLLHRGAFCQFLFRWIYYCHSKGQLISKCIFGIFNSPKKQTIKFDFTTMVPQVELFSFVLWKNWRHQKHFGINWPLPRSTASAVVHAFT